MGLLRLVDEASLLKCCLVCLATEARRTSAVMAKAAMLNKKNEVFLLNFMSIRNYN